jgi:hypothetical protein
VTLDFPLPERQRLALYLVRHLGGLNVALIPKVFLTSSLYIGEKGAKEAKNRKIADLTSSVPNI